MHILRPHPRLKKQNKKQKQKAKQTKNRNLWNMWLNSYPVESYKTKIWETLVFTIVLLRKKVRDTKQLAQFHVASELQNVSGYWNQQASPFHQKLLYL